MDAPAARRTFVGLLWWQWLLAAASLAMLAVTATLAYQVRRGQVSRQFEEACREAYKSEDWPRLLERAVAWREQDDSAALACIYAAEAAQRLEKFDQAADFLAQTPDDNPDLWLRAQEERMTLLFGIGNQPEEAVEVCRLILSRLPAHPEARQRLIFYYAMTVQRAKMIEEVRRAIEYGTDEPRNYVHLIGADYLVFTNGADANLQWLASDPDNETFHVARAMHLIKSGLVGNIDKEGTGPPEDDPEADGDPGPRGPSVFDRRKYHEKVLADYLERYPKNLELLAYFLDKAMTNGEVQRAAQLLAQAPPEAEEDSRFWRYRGWVLFSQQKYGQAEEAYRQSLATNPYDYLTMHLMADLYRTLQRTDEVDWLEEMAVEGKKLRRDIMELPNDREVTGELLVRMGEFAKRCGDEQAADALFRRINAAQGTGGPGLPMP